MKMRTACRIAVYFLFIPFAFSQPAKLVKDINLSSADSTPENLAVFGGKLYFSADDGIHGPELWRSDGTAAGTSMLADLIPGRVGANPTIWGLAGNNLFVASADGQQNSSQTLWSVNTTTGVASKLREFAVHPLGLGILDAVAVGSVLYFAPYDATVEWELWRSDGTAAETRLVKDIHTPNNGGASIDYLTSFNNQAFFVHNDGVNGYELWKSNGTTAGTVMVKDILDDAGSSPAELTVFNNKLYFSAETPGDSGRELWQSDGTESGTILLKDFQSGFFNEGAPGHFTIFKNELYFKAEDAGFGRELWKTNGTPAGTVRVTDINAGTGHAFQSTDDEDPDLDMAVFNNRLYFTADNGSIGVELWSTDGTGAGTSLVKEISTGTGGFAPEILRPIGTALLFTYRLSVSPFSDQLWRTNGTAPGTVQIDPGTLIDPREPTVLGSKLFFRAEDPVAGSELFVSDGTDGGTGLFKDINLNSIGSFSVFHSQFQSFLYGFIMDYNGIALFGASDGTIKLWRSDGTPSGTQIVKDIIPGIIATKPVLFKNRLYLIASTDAAGSQLWRTDGTAQGTQQVTNFTDGYPFGNLAVMGNFLYFAKEADTLGRELWRTDGTVTARVNEVAPGATSSFLSELTPIGSTLFFSATNGSPPGTELWKSDGTNGGTIMVKDINPGFNGSNPRLLTAFNGKLYFSAINNGFETGLYVSDGTPGGTTELKDLTPGSSNSSSPEGFTPFGSMLLFSATDRTVTPAPPGEGGRELWKTDGTAIGTVRVKDINPGAGDSNPTLFTQYNGFVYFQADDGTNGKELWRTNGTGAGTTLVKNINPSGDGDPRGLAVANGFLYFTANDGTTGFELWRTNGTASGTVRVQDIKSGAADSVPLGFAGAGNNVYFAADNGSVGHELWVLSPNAADGLWTVYQ